MGATYVVVDNLEDALTYHKAGMLHWWSAINLRTSEDAQPETAEVAEMIASHIKSLFPVSYEVLCCGQNSNP